MDEWVAWVTLYDLEAQERAAAEKRASKGRRGKAEPVSLSSARGGGA